MSGPLIYVGTYTIRPGEQENARRRLVELVDFVETNEPRLIAFNTYLDEDEGRTLSVVQVHPDSASMEFHMQVNAKHFASAYDWLDGMSDQYFGHTSDALAAELLKWNEARTHLPVHVAGFTRTTVR